MKTLQIFDPAMCCSSGVCGPSPDPKLARLSADVAFLKSQGIEVVRYNLAYQPAEFTANQLVLQEMGAEAEYLPIFLVDGELKAKGEYPNRVTLAEWFGLEAGIARDKPHLTLKVSGQTACSGEEGCC